MNASLSEQLISTTARAIGPDVTQRAVRHLLDWIGVAVLGATSDAGIALRHYGSAQPTGPSVALGAGYRDARSAAFVNGGLGNIHELDDVHRTSIMHAGDVVVPAALSAAQREDVTGTVLLKALVAGYETAIRIGLAASGSGYSPWYNSSACGVFGAASAAAIICGLNAGQHRDALGQAGMQAAGIWQCRLEPSFSKQLATAHAAQAGLIAVDLARIGFPAPRFILEGELGFFPTYYPQADQEAVVADLEAPWKLLETSFKPWPACRHTHPVLEAGGILRARNEGREIAELLIATYQAAIDFCDAPMPRTRTEAQFSLQHCLALSLIKDEVGLSDFSKKSRDDPVLAALRRKVNVTADHRFTTAFPTQYGAQINALFTDGTSEKIMVATAKGDPENPLSDDELIHKFDNCMALSAVDKHHADELKDAVIGLQNAPDMQTLSACLSAVSNDIAHNFGHT